MPVYDGECYIAEAVASVIDSAFRDFELLLLDDGSRDESVAAATHAASGDARFRVIPLPHGGVGAARNAGLREARGDLIANLDSDDAMFPERLGRQVAYLDAHPECVAVGSRALVVDAASRPVRVGVRLFSHEEIDGAHMEGRAGAIWNPTATFRKRPALAVGGYAAHLQSSGEDHDIWLRMAEVGRLKNLPDVLTRYRVHGSNVSLVAAEKEKRLVVTLDNLTRAFERRGITGRTPAKVSGPLPQWWERHTDAALLRYFSEDRSGALFHAVIAWIANPSAPSTRAAMRAILRSAPPRWRTLSTPQS